MGAKFFGSIATAMVIAVIIAGLILAGSPAKERERRFDTQRVNDIAQIASAIDMYISKNDQLPASLVELTKPEVARLYSINSIKDPKTAVEYQYATTGKTSYQLCATFEQPSVAKSRAMYGDNRGWEHPVGYKCFKLEAVKSGNK
ncbi:MAG: hypothetical protein M3R00_09115 [Pseudomonadota bacterium]|nr:hypothetical protein [Pseudomonadota bacterium]